ncbi:MAG: hypothetical protein OHK0053_30650 [Microscillaceae bacterium]
MLLFCALQGCGIYSFSGTSTDARTIFVDNFQNISGGGPPSLAQDFTEQLKEYYQRNSPLSLANEEAELIVRGQIKQYQVSPIAAGGDSRAAQNRLTIGIEVDFTDTRNEKANFTQTFTFYSDFAQELTLEQVEVEKIEEIFEQLILDIFNKTVADW